MRVIRVTRKLIREIKVGQTAVFTMPTEKAVFSARAQFSTMKRLEDMDFERVDVREPHTVAYKRTK